MARHSNTDDERRIGDLSLDELEAVVEERRRVERARAFVQADDTQRFNPITVQPNEKRKRRRRRGWRDNLLFLVEVAAVIGLVAIIVLAVGNLQALNLEFAQSIRQQQPQSQDAQPATNVSAAVAQTAQELPGSSFPSAQDGELPGSSSPPEALPASLGVSVQKAPALPPPTPGAESPTRLVIPAIDVDWPIVPGDGWEELKRGVGHHIGSANPGERGNLVLSGHNDVFGEVFKDLEALKNGDKVQVYVGGRLFTYEVRAKRIVSPNELAVLQPSREPIVTLITCHPYRVDTHRLVVIAQLIP